MTTASLLPKTRFGFVLVFVYFILMFLAALQNATAIESSPFYWMAVLAIFSSAIYYLIAVYRLHRVLVTATNGHYIVSPRKAVAFHFAPFFNLYWAFKWTGEIARYIEVASPERKIALRWLPGALILFGFFIGQGYDGGFSVLVNFAVLGWLIRRAKIGLEKGESSAQAYATANAGRALNMKVIWIAIAVCVLLMIFVTALNVAALSTGAVLPEPTPAEAPAGT